LPAATGGPDVGHVGAEAAGFAAVEGEFGVTGAKLAGRGAALAVEPGEVPIEFAIADDPGTAGVKLLVVAGLPPLFDGVLTAVVEGCAVVTDDGGAVRPPTGAADLAVAASGEELGMLAGDALGAAVEIAGEPIGG
jgi:hypothetical protein